MASVPGRHTKVNKTKWGHLKLCKVIMNYWYKPRSLKFGIFLSCQQISPLSKVRCLSKRALKFHSCHSLTSIGSLGNDKDRWLCSEWLQSLSTCSGNMMSSPPLHLVSMFLNLHYGWKLNTDLICKFASFLFWIRILWKFFSS